MGDCLANRVHGKSCNGICGTGKLEAPRSSHPPENDSLCRFFPRWADKDNGDQAWLQVYYSLLSLRNTNMPAVTRSRKLSKKSPDFYILIDKTPRNAVNKSVRTTATGTNKPKNKAASTLRTTAKSKAKTKVPAKSSAPQVVDEGTAQSTDVGEPDDSLQRALSITGPSGVFATPPQSHLPPQPPKRPEHRSHDPKTTLPPQFMNDETPSPEPARRHSHRVSARTSSLLPPSSPIHLSSSPVCRVHGDLSGSNPIFPSAHEPGSPSQFRTPTRRDRKRKCTPISRPQLESEGDVNNDDLFAHGVIDDLDEREDSVGWENAGSDKENLGGPPEIRGSDMSDNKNPLSRPITNERGILQPRDASLSPRSSGSDPFGFFATERLLKARRAERALDRPETGPSDTRREPRLPLGELTAAEAPATTVSQSVPLAASPSQPQPASTPPYHRYSDSEIEDLYAPASPPHTPRARLPQAHTMSPHSEATPVATTTPLTPRNGDSARAVTMRRRRQKELHGVSEHGSETEGNSAPSSPSPVKRVHQRPPDPESQLDYDHQKSEEEGKRPQKKPRLRGKGKGKENTRGKVSTMVDPMEAARRVLENAPRRRPERRNAPTSIRKTTTTDLVEGGSGVRAVRPRVVRRRGVTRTARGGVPRDKKGSGKSRPRKKGDESTPEDLREKREQERLERIEYFKQLEGYELPKENVYVI
ncbi:hypothetical protein BJV78DRAFT_621855 [Lactifluus subvellereus]|nr:hypothetical protein BJV78DRAFT_621855 [Lactifluus subvellereus]